MTIHITPEPAFSYVSFESNIAAASYGDLISRVIDTFNPGKFIVTVFANKVIFRVFIFIRNIKNSSIFYFQASPASAASRELESTGTIGDWRRHDIQFCRFASYDLTYAQYCKFPS
jgi:S-adenosylmethionine decarboxylase